MLHVCRIPNAFVGLCMIHPVIKKHTSVFLFLFSFKLHAQLHTCVCFLNPTPCWSLVPSFDRIKASKMTTCLWNCNNWVHMTRRLKPSNLWPRHEWSIYLWPWTADHGPAVEPAEFISLNKDKDIQYFLRGKKSECGGGHGWHLAAGERGVKMAPESSGRWNDWHSCCLSANYTLF